MFVFEFIHLFIRTKCALLQRFFIYIIVLMITFFENNELDHVQSIICLLGNEPLNILYTHNCLQIL